MDTIKEKSQMLMDILERNAGRESKWHNYATVVASTARLRLGTEVPLSSSEIIVIKNALAKVFVRNLESMEQKAAEPQNLVCPRSAEALLEFQKAGIADFSDEVQAVVESAAAIFEKTGPVVSSRLAAMMIKTQKAGRISVDTAMAEAVLKQFAEEGLNRESGIKPAQDLAFARSVECLRDTGTQTLKKLMDNFNSCSQEAIEKGSIHHGLGAVNNAEALVSLNSEISTEEKEHLSKRLTKIFETFSALDREINPETNANKAIFGTVAARTILGFQNSGLPVPEGAQDVLDEIFQRNIAVDKGGAVIDMHGYTAAVALEASAKMKF